MKCFLEGKALVVEAETDFESDVLVRMHGKPFVARNCYNPVRWTIFPDKKSYHKSLRGPQNGADN
jgi:hypothetical protein